MLSCSLLLCLTVTSYLKMKLPECIAQRVLYVGKLSGSSPSPCKAKVVTVRTYWGVQAYSYLILPSTLNESIWLHTPWPLYSRYPLNKRVGGLQTSGQFAPAGKLTTIYQTIAYSPVAVLTALQVLNKYGFDL